MTMRTALVFAVSGICATAASAQGRFTFEAFFGAAYNFGTSLTFAQESQPDLEIDADYATRAFELPPYYSFRFGVHGDGGAWEIQFTHHKLYLENNPPEIQNFEITHGFNVLVFGRAFSSVPVDVRIMGGLVIAHPDTEVRGMPFSPGYQLTGPAFLAGAGKSIDLTPWLFLSLDGQFLVARAKVPINTGTATTSSISIHGLFGLGVRF